MVSMVSKFHSLHMSILCTVHICISNDSTTNWKHAQIYWILWSNLCRSIIWGNFQLDICHTLTKRMISVINPGGIMTNKLMTETSHLLHFLTFLEGLASNDMCWSYGTQQHPKTLLFNRCLSDCNAILGPQITLDFNQHGESFLVAKPHTPRSPPSLICLAKRAFHWAQHGCRAGRGASGWEISKLSRSSCCWGGEALFKRYPLMSRFTDGIKLVTDHTPLRE